jgi:hypothetical protein
MMSAGRRTPSRSDSNERGRRRGSCSRRRSFVPEHGERVPVDARHVPAVHVLETPVAPDRSRDDGHAAVLPILAAALTSPA